MHIMNNAKGTKFTIKNAENSPEEGYDYVITYQAFRENGRALHDPQETAWTKTFLEAIQEARSLVNDIHDTIEIDWRNIKFEETRSPIGRLQFKIN